MTYEAPVLNQKVVGTLPADQVPKHWQPNGGAKDSSPQDSPIVENHPITNAQTGEIQFNKVEARFEVPEFDPATARSEDYWSKIGENTGIGSLGGALAGMVIGSTTGLGQIGSIAFGAAAGALTGGLVTKHLLDQSQALEIQKGIPTESWLEWREVPIVDEKFQGVETTAYSDGLVSHFPVMEKTEIGSYYEPKLVGLVAGSKVEYKLRDGVILQSSAVE